MKTARQRGVNMSRLLGMWAALLGGVALAFACPVVAEGAGDWAALSTNIFRSVGEVPGGSVTALTEDRDGYLWVGGESGLSRWDGYRFHSYTPDAHTPGWVNVLHTDHQGRLWIGTNSGGLSRYEAAGDRFVTYPAGPEGLSANSVSSLADDGADGLWIGTVGGLDHRIDRTGTVEHFRHDVRVPGSLPDNLVSAVLRDHNGTLWVATGGGLARRDPGSGEFVAVPLAGGDGQRPLPSTLFEDSGHRLWVGTHRQGVYVIAPDRRRASPFRLHGTSEAESLLEAADVRAINEVRGGELWFGTFNHGVISVDMATGQLRWMHNDPTVPTSLPEDSVFAIYCDRSGLAWVGTLSGLRRTDPRQTGISTVVVSSRQSATLASAEVTAVLSRSDHAWLGFRNGGVDIIDPRRGRLRSLAPDRLHPRTALPDAEVRALAGLPAGPMFIGTDRGLYRADSNGDGLRRISLPGLEHDDIFCLRIVGGTLWIGTEGAGVWRLDPRGDAAAQRPRRLLHAGLSDNRITVIAPASHGHIWIGTFSGLNFLNTQTGRTEPIGAGGANGDPLAGAIIASLLTDQQGRLWIGTFGEGIQILQPRVSGASRQFVHLSAAQGLPNVNVDSMFADRQNRIWAATDDGLAVIDSYRLNVHALHRADGVELTSYFAGAGATLASGDLLFGSTHGLTIVRPALVHDWTYAPPVVVTDIQVGGKSVGPALFDQDGRSLPVVISPDANSLAVEFAALDFSAPEQNRYQYRLVGFDDHWTKTDSSRRLAPYTNLPPGTYRLELRGSNRNGAWSASTRSMPIEVVPAWHQTIAFKLGEAIAGLALLAGCVQIRTAYLRRHERDLEQQVCERTAELQTLAVALGESKSQLERIAYRDPLTDLPNRRMFTQEIDRLLRSADAGPLSLLLIDLDRFKQINDTLGHDAGDALLVETARRLRGVVREPDCVARLGGDEFAIILADAQDNAQNRRICDRIVAAFDTTIEYKGTQIQASVSIGFSISPQHGTTQTELYKSADLALYEAKRAGRNTWRQYALETA
jgi:diguanylate cyclase (GGDEF)-like protein